MVCDNLEGWEVRGRFKREGTYVYLWLIHVDIWQKPTRYCKATTLQLKINKCLKKESINPKEIRKRGKKNIWQLEKNETTDLKLITILLINGLNIPLKKERFKSETQLNTV